MRKIKQKRGFTLMEMLIVVAIIAILVAIAVPSFTKQLHKTKVTADLANIRAYYSEIQAEYISTGEYDPSIGDDMWASITDTLTFPDGQQIKLQAGQCSIIRADSRRGGEGYQIHYFCNGSDGCTYTFGVSN